VPPDKEIILPSGTDPWEIVGYEAGQFRGTGAELSHPVRLSTQVLRNAVVESAVLHARILCDILLSRTNADDDIRLTELHLPGDVDPVSDKVDKKLLDQLAADYGNRRTPGTPCWEFNKMLAHPTTERSTSYDYSKALSTLGPTIDKSLSEIEKLRNVSFPPIA
jgi:hypothetical protein